ncbi:MAG TPA: ABC transporter substrate-binding protein [Candidatus Paceibacterota bacterium]|nr:ABC transporter substrate-binding protein [Candidatus Paceibacterota bacterium]
MKTRKKGMKLGGITLVVALALTMTTGSLSASAADSNATIDVGTLHEVQNLDNTANGGAGLTEAFNGNVYEGLFKLTDAGKIENLLASSYKKSRDGLTYTFSLRSGVKFHSGKTLTSADVKSSLERVTAEGSQSPQKGDLSNIASITTPDARTVVVTLSKKSISFVYNLTYVWIVNSALKDMTSAEDGTGPYKYTSWTRGSSISITRFDSYWGANAKNKVVVFHEFTDGTALNNALLSHAVDIITSEGNPDALAQFKNANFKITNGLSTNKQLIIFNDRAAPFNKALVRKAITSALDKKKLLSSVWGDYGTVLHSVMTPIDPGYEDLSSMNPYNPTLAKSQLAKAGYPKGFTFTLDTPNDDPHPALAAFIQSSLAEIGVTMKINIITTSQWFEKIYKKRDYTATIQNILSGRNIGWYGNPDFFWGYSNPRVTNLISQSESAGTLAAQAHLLKRANRLVVGEAASVWLYLYPLIVVSSSSISGYPINGINSQFFVYDITKN